ncbi:uncharacterized protein LAESUDRAFT_680482 [Laetiporus sulphureus 93-53]|uniref:Uncharacterized protein n=1 Tax=Laetiporus sulphureus 93-53 TaxID=1314785 RepID=A0A165DYT5_9APHY|nr:uncharacterized protein LAESUDRAFT_680482 [Laetiporus sulphureus 93-53]KZT05906.1 hypothetical protein LAESUDRAFT_680482 [Laetiporus sulphureus 93-53]
MATATSVRAPPATSRRSPHGSSKPSASPPSVARGATARSAVSPRLSVSMSAPAARRASLRGGAHPPPVVTSETRETLAVSLKEETEKKEQLLVQLQEKEQTISNLTSENANLSSALHSAESRLAELYADQSRMEEEMAARIEVIEKLRTQVRDLEKEKRDVQRRYNEQTATFEAERQAFYDNEQHLKSRIQSLTQARKQPALSSPSVVSVVESVTEPSLMESEADVEAVVPASQVQVQTQDVTDPEQEPAEMTGLKLELSTLSTSYSSLQSTLQLLQTQLVDLKRVNHELQEENESYNILLREKTLNGQFDVLRMGVSASASETSLSEGEEDGDTAGESESMKSRNTGRSVLDPVDELAEEHELDPAFELAQDREQESRNEDELYRHSRRHGRKQSNHSLTLRGESLANLPITGPGLDLAAELGRAENKDILEGHATIEDRPTQVVKTKKHRKHSTSDRKMSSASDAVQDSGPWTDLDALRNEVKSLKDANKALSLYASKIIDRIISQEGFEHVLAVDYEKHSPPLPKTPSAFTTFDNIPKSHSPPKAQPQKKGRTQSAIFSFSSSPSSSNGFLSPTPNSSSAPSPPARSRRSLSFDWKSFSMFGGGGDKKVDPAPSLRPLTLRAGTSQSISSARKLDTFEDEEDRKERERLNATMKLMGIEKPVMPAIHKSYSAPGNPTDGNGRRSPLPASPVNGGNSPVVPPTASYRFSFFRRNSSMTPSDTSSGPSSIRGSPHASVSGANTPNLTQEALAQAEAANTLAALDAHERQLSAEIAKGAGGGFTEIVRRTGDRRSSRKSGESASTVWSAGMSRGEDGDD